MHGLEPERCLDAQAFHYNGNATGIHSVSNAQCKSAETMETGPPKTSACVRDEVAAVSTPDSSDVQGPATPPAQSRDSATVNGDDPGSAADDEGAYWGPSFGDEGVPGLADPQSFSELAPAAEAQAVGLYL
jgi:hypothetical protein